MPIRQKSGGHPPLSGRRVLRETGPVPRNGIYDFWAMVMNAVQQSILNTCYYAKAKQFLYDRGRLEESTDDELAKLAEYLRHQDFLLATRPYVQQKERIVSQYFSLQSDPTTAQLPKELEDALKQWDEMIATVARQFGYELS